MYFPKYMIYDPYATLQTQITDILLVRSLPLPHFLVGHNIRMKGCMVTEFYAQVVSM